MLGFIKSLKEVKANSPARLYQHITSTMFSNATDRIVAMALGEVVLDKRVEEHQHDRDPRRAVTGPTS